ncbi:Endonuclease/exonuclease/phosphatase, partial [Mycena polygramma]
MQQGRREQAERAAANPAPPPEPPPARTYPGPARPNATGKQKTKLSVKISALNMKGNGNVNVFHPDNKWWHIWQIIREHRLGILITTESHLDAERTNSINLLFGKKLRIEFSKDPETANARGVAFVISKDKIKMDSVETREIIPGRAMILNVIQHDGSPLSILGVYAPNPASENAAFWKKIQEFYEAHPRLRKPDILGGDTNVVEDALDRQPARNDPDAPVSALDDLKMYLNLIDGWRETNPTTRAFTYHQIQTGSQSRIDRIYIRRSLFENSFEWGIKTVGIETDHRMVSVRLTCENAPTMGHGRWVWPDHIIRDKTLTNYIHEKGLILHENLEKTKTWEARVPEFNPQTLWAEFKTDIGKKARERAKAVVPKMTKDIKELEERLDEILNDKDLNEEERTLSAAVYTEKLLRLEQQRHRSARMTAQARNRLEGEIIGRYWSRLNKPTRPREMIDRLKKPNENPDNPNAAPIYETRSAEMATMARNYHNKIQFEGRNTAADEREAKIQTVLGRTARTTTDEQKEELKRKLTRLDVKNALKLSANKKAPGLDGITYEVWKVLDSRYETAISLEKSALDVLGALLTTYNDIETHGMVPGLRFAESWMCPLYKKNDKADIANYRPISLLNTDYKIFTKALTIKL